MRVQNTYKSIWKVALPIIIGSLAQSMINLIDTAFLGRVNEITLGAAAIGGIFYLISTILCMGLGVGAQIIIARRTGEGNDRQVGEVFDQSLYLLALFGLSMFLLMYFPGSWLQQAVLKSGPVYLEVQRYMDIRAFGVLFVAFNMVYRALYVGLSKTAVLTYSTLVMAGVNIFLDYCLIFGKLGFPEMGIQGAALASVIAEGTALIYFIGYTKIYLPLKKYRLYKFDRWQFPVIKRVFKLASPIVLQNFLGVGSWFVFFVIIEQTGETELAVSNVLRSLLLLFMVPVWGLATTANTMTSNIIGQKFSGQVMSLDKKIMSLGFVWILFFLPLMFIKPEWLIHIITDDPTLIDAAIKPLYVIYAALFVFVPAVILLHSLSGTGDTRTALLIEFVAIAAYLVYTIIIALVIELPLSYIWMAEVIYWTVILSLAFARLKGGKWIGIEL